MHDACLIKNNQLVYVTPNRLYEPLKLVFAQACIIDVNTINIAGEEKVKVKRIMKKSLS